MRSSVHVSRRSALTGFGAAGLGLALTATARPTAAQDETLDLANHPLTGTWAALTPGGVVPQIHGADGTIIAAYPSNYIDPALGLIFQGPALGQWEADGERTGHFTFIQALSDAVGTYVGTAQLSAGIETSDDGQTWFGNDQPRVILRDAANNVTFDEVFPIDPPVTGTRIGSTADSIVLPVVTPAAATPTT